MARRLMSRLRVYHGKKKPRCPRCKQVALRLIIPWDADDDDWRKAWCNRCARELEVEQ